MEKYSIAFAHEKDLESIENIYEIARDFMKASGNETQWNNNYPDINTIKEDIENNSLFIITDEEEVIHAVFFFMIGDEPCYEEIKGEWLSGSEYGVIHRVASDGKIPGIIDKVVAFCEKQISHLRIDTHENNKVMQHLLERNGFKKCGIIHVEDGSERLAYEKI